MKITPASFDPWLSSSLPPDSSLPPFVSCSNHVDSLKICWIGHILSRLLIFFCFPSCSSLYVADLKSFSLRNHYGGSFILSTHSDALLSSLLAHSHYIIHLWLILSFPLFGLQYLAQCLVQIGNYHPLEEQKNKWKYKVVFFPVELTYIFLLSIT